jgi:hypothetical protein
MTERKVIIIHRGEKGVFPTKDEIRLWHFTARLHGFVGSQHLIKVGDLLWYNDQSRFKSPTKTLYFYPVEVTQLGKGNEKVKVKFTDENGNMQEKWIWSSSLRREVRSDK